MTTPLHRRWPALAAGLMLAAVAACGAAPEGTDSPTAPAAASPSALRTDAPSSSAPTSPATISASPTSTPTASAPSQPEPEPEPTFWVGRFEGKKVKIPYGRGAHVSFTFDDGPSPTYTPQVLALLKKHHVPAVFCLIGTEARSYPALVRTEVRAGHQLCDHSRDHDIFMNNKGQAHVQAEVDDGLAAIRAAAPGVPVGFYRQPGGTWSPKVVRAMKRAHLTSLRWSDDPRDWSRPGSEVIVRTVVKKLRPGAVILMHDGGGDRSQSVKALAFLLPSLEAAGWQPVPAPKVKISDAEAAKPQ